MRVDWLVENYQGIATPLQSKYSIANAIVNQESLKCNKINLLCPFFL